MDLFSGPNQPVVSGGVAGTASLSMGVWTRRMMSRVSNARDGLLGSSRDASLSWLPLTVVPKAGPEKSHEFSLMGHMRLLHLVPMSSL